MPATPVLLPFETVTPTFAAPPVRADAGAVVIGRATLGSGLDLGAWSVVRGDGNVIRTGDDVVLGPGVTLHIVHDALPCILGHRVTVGANACVHACEVGDDVVIGRDCVILDGSVVGAGVVLEPGSVVFPRSTLEAGKVYAGKPAKPVGDATADERATRAAAIRADRDTSWRPPCEAPPAIIRHPSAYIASTARVSGAVRMAAGTSLWFGCAVDARGGPVVIGENTNVQDNTRIVTTTARGVRIGRETTIGHNVLIEDCEIGERCLIGIGAHVASGTVIEPGVLLAGGAVTAPGQVLTADAVWGGTPARKLSAMDAARHDTTARIVQGYCAYARAYAEVPAAVFAG